MSIFSYGNSEQYERTVRSSKIKKLVLFTVITELVGRFDCTRPVSAAGSNTLPAISCRNPRGAAGHTFTAISKLLCSEILCFYVGKHQH